MAAKGGRIDFMFLGPLYPVAGSATVQLRNFCRASSRHCYETCQIGGYTIPAGVQIQMNIEAVHMNPDLWGPEDPKKIVPERYTIGLKVHTNIEIVGIADSIDPKY